MSENQAPAQNPALVNLKRTHEMLVFIHQAITQKNQYFIEEFEIAKASIQMITEMANNIGKEIFDAEKPMRDEAERVAAENEKADAERTSQVVEGAPSKPKSKRKSKKNLEVVSE